jgi:hypothetical protein
MATNQIAIPQSAMLHIARILVISLSVRMANARALHLACHGWAGQYGPQREFPASLAPGVAAPGDASRGTNGTRLPPGAAAFLA